jgi:hypothetical protein
MADVILSSCCYTQIVYSATSWAASTTPGDVFSISGDSNIVEGCYTIISTLTGTPVTFDGTAIAATGCTDTICLDCCDGEICIHIPIDSYSGYNGDYSVVGSYNTQIYLTGGTQPGYLFFDNTKWCLSNSFSGTCLFYGPNPTEQTCPDLDSSIASIGLCTPSPTPYAATLSAKNQCQ